jgi:hypothetical protein
MNFMDIFKNILKEISKVIYKYYDETIGVIFYCSVVSNLDVDYAPFFWSLHQNTKITNKGVQINEVVNFLKIFGLSKPKKLLELILNELEDDEEYFHELNYDNYNLSFLNSLGVDRVLLLPRKNDFPKIKSVIKIYNEFKTEFFNSMINFFNDDDECSYALTLSNQLLQTQTVNNNLVKYVTNIILEKLSDVKIISKVENKFKISLYRPLPILYKSNSKYAPDINKEWLYNIISSKFLAKITDESETGKLIISNHEFIYTEIIKFILEY